MLVNSPTKMQDHREKGVIVVPRQELSNAQRITEIARLFAIGSARPLDPYEIANTIPKALVPRTITACEVPFVGLQYSLVYH